jgi:HJR/Mrr/RecB family endonuclease
VSNEQYREPQQAARQAGLKARHETREARAIRRQVAEEIAQAFEEARVIPNLPVFSRQADRLTAARMVREYARQMDAREINPEASA